MRIIGFTGKKRSGKTLASDYLVEKYGFIKIGFKDALVNELKQNFPRILNFLSESYSLSIDELFIDKPAPVRYLLQEYGTEVRRNDDVDYWVNKWSKSVNNPDKSKYNGVVVDDIRFLNESAFVKRLGGTIIKITRSGVDNNDNHQSEKEMDDIAYDINIENNTTVDDLYKKLDIIL